MLIGEAARNARHFDRAVDLLRRALPQLPAQRDDLLFSIGRADFGRERYAEAEKTYLEGAQAARDGETRANFLYNASRCAQLLGDDARAERLPHQRDRARRQDDAGLLRPHPAPADPRPAEAAGGGAGRPARGAEGVPEEPRRRGGHPRLRHRRHRPGQAGPGPARAGADQAGRLLEKKDVPEIQYWKARAVEASRSAAGHARLPEGAARRRPHPLRLLRAAPPGRRSPWPRTPARRRPRARRRPSASWPPETSTARGRRRPTPPSSLPRTRRRTSWPRLAEIYRRSDDLPQRARAPAAGVPALPALRGGGGDGAGPARPAAGHGPLRRRHRPHPGPLPAAAAGRRAWRGRRRCGAACATRQSIYAAEVVARDDIPDDYLPPLLPRLVRELLYPRYFYDVIAGRVPEARGRPAPRALDHARGVAVQPAREVGRRRPRPPAVHHHHRPRRRAGHRPRQGLARRTSTIRGS